MACVVSQGASQVASSVTAPVLVCGRRLFTVATVINGESKLAKLLRISDNIARQPNAHTGLFSISPLARLRKERWKDDDHATATLELRQPDPAMHWDKQLTRRWSSTRCWAIIPSCPSGGLGGGLGRHWSERLTEKRLHAEGSDLGWGKLLWWCRSFRVTRVPINHAVYLRPIKSVVHKIQKPKRLNYYTRPTIKIYSSWLWWCTPHCTRSISGLRI